MDDFAPPSGPPPPKAPEVPAGWVARWNEQYKEWFYVNVYTKKSQWDKPTAPVFPVDENMPDDPPPGYEPGHGPAPTDTKKNPYEDRSGQNKHASSSSAQDEDAKLAAKLQAEEDAKARGGPTPPAGYATGGAADSYAQGHTGQSQGSFPTELPPRDDARGKDRGFLGKLFGKGKTPQSGQANYGGGYPQQQQQQQQNYYQSPPPQQYGGGYAQQGPPPMGGYGGGYGQPTYGGYPPQGGYGGGYGGGYPPGGNQQQSGRRPGGGMGGMGMGLAGGALGLGAGVLGGALIADAIHDHDQGEYNQGYQDGMDNDYGGGGDFDGGGDF